MIQLTSKALDHIKQSQQLKLKLATALNCSQQTINRYLVNNDDNLTKAAALEIIAEGTGLKDSEILEDVPSKNSIDAKLRQAS
jgi:hypothetical protein